MGSLRESGRKYAYPLGLGAAPAIILWLSNRSESAVIWGTALIVLLTCNPCVLVSLASGRVDNTIAASNPTRGIVVLGLMAALAGALQAMPVFLLGSGLVLATSSSLPVLVGTLLYPAGALPMVMASIYLLSLIHVGEAVVLALTTGPLGIAAAWAGLSPAPRFRSLVPGITLANGILILSFGVGLPALGPLVHSMGPGLALAAYVTFGMLYSWPWVASSRKIRDRLIPLFQDNSPGKRLPGYLRPAPENRGPGADHPAGDSS